MGLTACGFQALKQQANRDPGAHGPKYGPVCGAKVGGARVGETRTARILSRRPDDRAQQLSGRAVILIRSQ